MNLPGIEGTKQLPVSDMLKRAKELQASDLQLTVGVPPIIKVNGAWMTLGRETLMPEDTERLVRELFPTQAQLTRYLEEGDFDFSVSIPRSGRFRVNAFLQRGSMAAAVRLVHAELPDPLELGIPQAVMDMHQYNKGLVLVTGPTGSGKSTTLSCLIDRINKTRNGHILTLEEPIEYLHRHNHCIVNQREIGEDTRDYARALRSALRESPDVILLGEMRDLETMSIAMTAAETGHLVFSTLHTVGASKTIDRIIDVFPPGQQQQIRIQLSTVLQAVVSQQLIPSAARGRVPAFEIMKMNNAMRNLIREAKTYQMDTAIATGKATGMVSMDGSLADLVGEGLITREDAFAHCVNPEVLTRLLAGQEKH
jgi:twitching motility protein PilT